MFTWAVLDFDDTIIEIHKADIDVAMSRPGSWVIVNDGTKNCPGAHYNRELGTIEHG